MKIIFCGIWPNYIKKMKENNIFAKFQQNYAKNTKKNKKCDNNKGINKRVSNNVKIGSKGCKGCSVVLRQGNFRQNFSRKFSETFGTKV